MNQNNITTTTNQRWRQALPFLVSVLLVLSAQLMAHGGFDHVIGTVVKVENNVLTVKTTQGNIDVRLNEKTEITKSDQKTEIADLKPGARVVVDIPEGSKDADQWGLSRFGSFDLPGPSARKPQRRT